MISPEHAHFLRITFILRSSVLHHAEQQPRSLIAGFPLAN